MRVSSGYWLTPIAVTLCVCCLWKIGSIGRWSSSVRAKIHFDLSIPSSPIPSAPRRPLLERSGGGGGDVAATTIAHRRRPHHHGTLSRYMLQLYQRRPDADMVRAIRPVHTTGPLDDGGRILEFAIPPSGADERLEAAELLGIAGAIVRVRSLDLRGRSARGGSARDEVPRSRRDDGWRMFDVTSAIVGRNGDTVKLYVHGRLTYRPYGDTPILLLNYTRRTGGRTTTTTTTTARQRQRRSTRDDVPRQENARRGHRPENAADRWKEEREEEAGVEEEEDPPRKRRRNVCRRRSMYVDFALIAYDRWVIAPPGYEAYQCSGKCLYPLGDHLSPTKHAIVQTLVHGALQGANDLGGGGGGRSVGRPCCVPTSLAPTSLLYLDDNGAVTYQYGYEDMVVAECGCR